nr:MAG TPA: hypothetical protein [Crassvirales sp.]
MSKLKNYYEYLEQGDIDIKILIFFIEYLL